MPNFQKNTNYKMEKSKGNFDFGTTMDLSVDRYGPSAGETKAMDNFKFTKNNKKKKK